MKSLLKAIFLVTVVGWFSSCEERRFDPSLTALLQESTAKKAIKEKLNDKALATYLKILETDPELPEVHSNVGVLFLSDKKNDEAFKSLLQAHKLAELKKDPTALFVINYNLGVYYGAQKKVPEALEYYQAALEFNPSSKETKHNIELLIQSNSKGSQGGENQDSDQQNQNGESKDSKDKKDGKDNKDQKDQKDKKDDKDQKDKDGKDKDKPDEKDGKEKDKDVEQNKKYKPRPYKGDQLSEGDVKKILGELKNQEQKIRANFEKKERKENKNEKDW